MVLIFPTLGRFGRVLEVHIFDPAPLAPLFEEERDAGVGALVADATRPVGVHRAGAGAAFATDDDLMERRIHAVGKIDRAIQVEDRHRL